MANKHLIETFRRNGRNYLRLNLKRADLNYKPTPVVKPGWKLPEYPEIYCIYCKERFRPKAYNDCGEIHLYIGCYESEIQKIAWPFTEDYISNAQAHLSALGFEYSWW